MGIKQLAHQIVRSGDCDLGADRKPKLRLRGRAGSALSEFGPALFLLLVFGFLPVIDLIFLGLDYASAYYLLELQLREAQKLPRSFATKETGPVIQTIPSSWCNSLLGGLVTNGPSGQQAVVTVVDYLPVPWQPVGANQTINFWFVTVNTTVTFRPLLTIPFLNGIPGLGAPFTFTVAGRRPVENNRFLNE